MDPRIKQSIKLAFEKVNGAYKNLTIKEASNYYLVLGNVNEVHLIRKDAKKSVFLDRLFANGESTIEAEAAKVWEAVKNYFRSITTPAQAPVAPNQPKAEPKQKTSRKKKATPEVPVVEEVIDDPNGVEDDTADWVETVL